MKVNLNTESIRLISLFQEHTGTHVLDSYEDDEIYFVVAENEYGLAVGKNGNKIRKVEFVLKKPVKVFEYSKEIEHFIRNMIPQAKEISIRDNKIEVRVSQSDRSKVSYRVKVIEHFVKRFFSDVQSFKVK